MILLTASQDEGANVLGSVSQTRDHANRTCETSPGPGVYRWNSLQTDLQELDANVSILGSLQSVKSD